MLGLLLFEILLVIDLSTASGSSEISRRRISTQLHAFDARVEIETVIDHLIIAVFAYPGFTMAAKAFGGIDNGIAATTDSLFLLFALG